MKTRAGLRALLAAALVGATITAAHGSHLDAAPPGFVTIPAGEFDMGDHHGFVDPKHGGDETPVHTVRLDSFHMAINTVTTGEYCEFLNSSLQRRAVEVREGGVFFTGGAELLCETRQISPHSRIGWDGMAFSVLDNRANHPIVCIRWPGAAAYCNWLSATQGRPRCYNPATWDCDFNKSGFRLPTEAEWEFAARGGLLQPYRNFPWGDEPDASRANWPESRNPFRSGPQPWTTPVGFFDGRLHRKSEFVWPAAADSFQTSNGANGYGLHDMTGNVWQFVNDWYSRDYYAHSPTNNPAGPASGSPMPDGKTYRGMRGGNWYNGETGHGRVSNRNPSYFRGPQDPVHPYYHIGFRIVLPDDAESRPLIRPTPVERNDAREGRARPETANPSRRPRPQATPSQRETGNQERKPMLDSRRTDPGMNPAGDDGARERNSGFTLMSPEVTDGGALPAEFTADGASATLPLNWTNAPAGTTSYAVIMHHEAPDRTKWYWILYNIPAEIHYLPKNARNVGTLGVNSVNDRNEYAPPRSKGPGPKTYTYTVYALSSAPKPSVPPTEVDREALLAAMNEKVLATATLSVVYTRPDGAEGPSDDARAPRKRPQDADPRGTPPQRRREAESSGIGRGGKTGEIAGNKTPKSPNPDQTVGLFLNTPQASRGFTLFAPKHNTITYLIDNEGQIVHQWKSAYEPGQSAYLLPNGHLVRAGMLKVQGGTGGGEGGRIEEFDWDGNLVWEYERATRDYQLHHDIKPMPNGHILALMVERRSREQALAAGFGDDLLRDDYIVPDAVVEIEPTLPKGGRIVWEWHVWDHLIQGSDRTKPNYGDVAAHPELVDVACNGRATPAFWNHMNSIDFNPAADEILLTVRGCNEIWILDHSTTVKEATGHTGGKHGKGGDLIYRWGNPAAYGRGNASDKQLVQQHDAEWIQEGSPGAGHITVFNNGYDRGYSSIEEIIPPLGPGGRYTLPAGLPYGPDKPFWHYEAKPRTDFFSSEISGAHRLPNGNTLVCAGVVGHLFEVTPTGEMVWQYVNPMVRGGILAQGELPGKDMRGHLWNAVFKARRYAVDFPGLTGRDLTPKGLIELPGTEKGKTGLDKLMEQPRPDRAPEGQGRGRRRDAQAGGIGNRDARPPSDGQRER